MPDLLLLVPDFLLIACGWGLCRFTAIDRPVWDGAERLVYHVLFPALLFTAILRSPQPPAALVPMVAAGAAVVMVGVALALALGRWHGIDPHLHASGAQTAYRFNTFVALAMAERLVPTQGVAWIALIVSVCVPLVNVAAVWPLARHGGRGVGRELLRNPLIVATVAGLACNLLGVVLPELLVRTAQRIGSAALPIGLMAVGAGLRFGALREGPGLAAALMLIRHLVLPAVAIALVLAIGLPSAQQAVVVVFAAVPTASSAYVLAVRMGGHGPYVAGLVMLSTLIAMVGLPLALLALKAAQSL